MHVLNEFNYLKYTTKRYLLLISSFDKIESDSTNTLVQGMAQWKILFPAGINQLFFSS